MAVRYSIEQINKAVEMYINGCSYDDILKITGVPNTSTLKVEVRKRGITAVGKVLGVRGNTISSYINKYLKES